MGKQVISLPSCHSTNTVVAEMAANSNLHDGAIVITENQTKGKGQRGNTWESIAGENLTFSIFVRPTFLKPAQQFELNRISSLAVYDTLLHFLPEAKHFVKWPNDLILNGKKVAGILIENSINSSQISESIIGIGLNVNQTLGLLSTATSLKKEGDIHFVMNEILQKMVARLEHYYLVLRSGDFRYLHQYYESRLYKKNKVAYYESQEGRFNGIIQEVKSDGVLVIAHEDGRLLEFQFKEVKLLG